MFQETASCGSYSPAIDSDLEICLSDTNDSVIFELEETDIFIPINRYLEFSQILNHILSFDLESEIVEVECDGQFLQEERELNCLDYIRETLNELGSYILEAWLVKEKTATDFGVGGGF